MQLGTFCSSIAVVTHIVDATLGLLLHSSIVTTSSFFLVTLIYFIPSSIGYLMTWWKIDRTTLILFIQCLFYIAFLWASTSILTNFIITMELVTIIGNATVRTTYVVLLLNPTKGNSFLVIFLSSTPNTCMVIRKRRSFELPVFS